MRLSYIDQILERELKILVKSINSYAKDIYLMADEMEIHKEKLENILGGKSSIYDTVKKLEKLNYSLENDYEKLDSESTWDGWSFE